MRPIHFQHIADQSNLFLLVLNVEILNPKVLALSPFSVRIIIDYYLLQHTERINNLTKRNLHPIGRCAAYRLKRRQWQKGSSVSCLAPALHHERGSSHWSHSALDEKHFQSFQETEGELTTFAAPPHCQFDYLNKYQVQIHS